MGEFSLTHLLLLSLIFLVFFGPSRLPQLGQSLGKAIRGFKQGLNEIDVDVKDIQDKPLNQTQQMPQAQQQMPHTQANAQTSGQEQTATQEHKHSVKGDA
jgi:sec-independent protein translocase protein TatA